jgi:hypothetical protein
MEATDQQQGSSAGRRGVFTTGEALVALGFMPGVPHYEISSGAVGFDVDLLRKALFETTCHAPVTLPLQIADINDVVGDFLPLIVASVQAIFEPQERDHHGRPVGCYDAPNWLARGHLVKSPHDPCPEFIWIIAYLITDGSDRNRVDRIQVQLIRDGIDGARPW